MYDWIIRIASTLSRSFHPLLAFQDGQARKKRFHMPVNSEQSSGNIPIVGTPLELVMLGETSALGKRSEDSRGNLHEETAEYFARYMENSVNWQTLGKNLISAHAARHQLVPKLFDLDVDILVLMLGKSDALNLNSPRNWQRDLGKLIDAIRLRAGGIPIVIAPMPPIGKMPMLPQPLRTIYRLRAKALDIATRQWVKQKDHVYYIGSRLRGGKELFANDGFNYSPQGMRTLGETIGRSAARIMEPHDTMII